MDISDTYFRLWFKLFAKTLVIMSLQLASKCGGEAFFCLEMKLMRLWSIVPCYSMWEQYTKDGIKKSVSVATHPTPSKTGLSRRADLNIVFSTHKFC